MSKGVLLLKRVSKRRLEGPQVYLQALKRLLLIERPESNAPNQMPRIKCSESNAPNQMKASKP